MMATRTEALARSTPRRIVLIDFDWQDADLLPSLLQLPHLAVRLVAGERPDQAGVKMAEMCGLPRTLDLADLTREIFDCALVSERSPRRSQIESLLLALGTPCVSPQAFLDDRQDPGGAGPAIVAPAAIHAAAFETTIGGGDFASIVEQTLGDESLDAAGRSSDKAAPAGGFPLQGLKDFPSPEDRAALEQALTQLAEHTGAGRVEIHAGREGGLELIAQVGAPDPILPGLVGLAIQLNTPQLVRGLSAPHQGKVWGAWPFRTTQHQGVLAAAAIDESGGLSSWESMVEELRTTWDRQGRGPSEPEAKAAPEPPQRWLEVAGFRARLEQAVERNRAEGLSLNLHRLEFPGPPEPLATLCALLPQQLRETDFVCRPSPRQVLLLTSTAEGSVAHVRRRLLELWEQAWRESGQKAPAPPIRDLRADMVGPEDAPGFLAAADGWLAAE